MNENIVKVILEKKLNMSLNLNVDYTKGIIEMRTTTTNSSLGVLLIDSFIKTNGDIYDIMIVKNNLNNYGFSDN